MDRFEFKGFELTHCLTFLRLLTSHRFFQSIVSNLLAEDNLNISLRDITVTGRDGRVSQLDQVYIRGSMIRFFIVPDMLQNAPMYVSSFVTRQPLLPDYSS